jgi:hypothetical protein
MLENRAMLAAILMQDHAIIRVIRTLSCMDAAIMEAAPMTEKDWVKLVVKDMDSGHLWDMVFSANGLCVPRFFWK